MAVRFRLRVTIMKKGMQNERQASDCDTDSSDHQLQASHNIASGVAMETGNTTDKRGGVRAGAGRPKGIKIPYKTISMRLPEEYVDKLHIAAEKSGLSINGFMKKAIDSELERTSENNA